MSLRGAFPLAVVGMGLLCSMAYYYRDEIAYFTSYYSASEGDKQIYEELDRIEQAISLLCSLVLRLQSVRPSNFLNKLKEIEVDADFVLESLDGVGGSELLRARRKKLVQKTLALTAQIDTMIKEHDLLGNEGDLSG